MITKEEHEKCNCLDEYYPILCEDCSEYQAHARGKCDRYKKALEKAKKLIDDSSSINEEATLHQIHCLIELVLGGSDER